MLIDLDLAKEIGSKRSAARHKTGTMEFVAVHPRMYDQNISETVEGPHMLLLCHFLFVSRRGMCVMVTIAQILFRA